MIKPFIEKGYYDLMGRARAIRLIKRINAGTEYYSDPLYMQDHAADSEALMKSVALYLSENLNHQLRIDYLSNKLIDALNRACRSIGLPEYVEVTDDDIMKDRIIDFDEPDYSTCDQECREFLLWLDMTRNNLRESVEEFVREPVEEADDYNRELLGDEYVDQMQSKRKENEGVLFGDINHPEMTSMQVGRLSFATRGLAS